MSNLLSAEFSRLFKNKLFYISLAICVIIPIIASSTALMDLLHHPDYHFQLTAGSLPNVSFLYAGMVSAVFVSLFIGREFSDGTMRNKLIVGHSRIDIYLSNLIVCIVSELILQIAYFITLTILFFSLFDGYEKPFQSTFTGQLVGLVIIAVYSALFLLITMLIDSKSKAIAASVIVALVLFISGQAVYQTVFASLLNASIEYGQNVEMMTYRTGVCSYVESSVALETPKTPESAIEYYQNYLENECGKGLSGIKKTVCLFLDDILPSCQAEYLNILGMYQSEEKSMIDGYEVPLFSYVLLYPNHTVRYVLCDCLTAIVITTIGILLFKRKDLR